MAQIDSFWSPFDPSSSTRAALLERHKAVAATVGVDATMLFCVCRRPEDVVRSMLGGSALLLVGGRLRRWWPTAEQRLVGRLTADGYPVVFTPVGAGHVCPPLSSNTLATTHAS